MQLPNFILKLIIRLIIADGRISIIANDEVESVIYDCKTYGYSPYTHSECFIKQLSTIRSTKRCEPFSTYPSIGSGTYRIYFISNIKYLLKMRWAVVNCPHLKVER